MTLNISTFHYPGQKTSEIIRKKPTTLFLNEQMKFKLCTTIHLEKDYPVTIKECLGVGRRG